MLKSLSQRISVEAQAWLDERMLEVARPKHANVPPNHSIAEQAYLRELARVPWAPDAPNWSPGNEANWAWRTELVDMLSRAIKPPWQTPSSMWSLVVEPNGNRTVRYPEQQEGQVLRWRLREAAGTVFLRDAKSQIGFSESMKLGETLRLS
jgi:hypothetical protein